jgi:hypothetical protein
VLTEAWSPLGQGAAFEAPAVVELAELGRGERIGPNPDEMAVT